MSTTINARKPTWHIQPFGSSWFALEMAADRTIIGIPIGPMDSERDARERIEWIMEERAALGAVTAVQP